MQQPSSLIFLAIVVIWAGYLLQHWIRRREALATARSVDQFSDAMRVLDRRDHQVQSVTDQTSESPHASRSSAPRAGENEPRPSLRAGTIMTGETQQPRPAPARRVAETPEPAAPKRRIAITAGSPKLRAGALILSVSVLLITIVCAPFGALPWWSPILMLAVTGGIFVWCRASAMATAARRPAGATGSRPAARPAPVQTADAKSRRGVKLPKRKTSAPPAEPVPQLTKATMPEPVVQPAPAEQVYDVTAFSAPAPQPVAPVAQPDTVVAQAGDAAWQPVAVPPPTYTMKERAPERPEQAPAPTVSAKSYEHVANEDLPFDGLALDQDLDDLPSVFRAG